MNLIIFSQTYLWYFSLFAEVSFPPLVLLLENITAKYQVD